MLSALPVDLVSYRRTATFDQDSVPRALLTEHRLKAGSWGRIMVLSGVVDYVLQGRDSARLRLDGATPGFIEPLVPHHLELCGPVQFYVEFLRRPVDG